MNPQNRDNCTMVLFYINDRLDSQGFMCKSSLVYSLSALLWNVPMLKTLEYKIFQISSDQLTYVQYWKLMLIKTKYVDVKVDNNKFPSNNHSCMFFSSFFTFHQNAIFHLMFLVKAFLCRVSIDFARC